MWGGYIPLPATYFYPQNYFSYQRDTSIYGTSWGHVYYGIIKRLIYMPYECADWYPMPGCEVLYVCPRVEDYVIPSYYEDLHNHYTKLGCRVYPGGSVLIVIDLPEHLASPDRFYH